MQWAYLSRAAAPRETKLQRLFSAFPGALPGVGLFALRAAVGIIYVAQGGAYFASPNGQSLFGYVVAAVAALTGLLIVAGLLTPLAAAVAVPSAVAFHLAWLPVPSLNLFDTVISTLLVAIIATAVALLGPGALSVDARLFGRREIFIPYR